MTRPSFANIRVFDRTESVSALERRFLRFLSMWRMAKLDVSRGTDDPSAKSRRDPSDAKEPQYSADLLQPDNDKAHDQCAC